MRLPTSDKTLRDYESVHIEVGEDDTHCGIHLKVANDLYDRIHITAQGQYLVGDGTVPPTPLSVGGASVETIVAGDNIEVDDIDPAHPRGSVTTPAFPAASTTVTNTTGFRVVAYTKWAATAPTAVTINAIASQLPGAAINVMPIALDPGGTFSFTGTAASGWTWIAN